MNETYLKIAYLETGYNLAVKIKNKTSLGHILYKLKVCQAFRKIHTAFSPDET